MDGAFGFAIPYKTRDVQGLGLYVSPLILHRGLWCTHHKFYYSLCPNESVGGCPIWSESLPRFAIFLPPLVASRPWRSTLPGPYPCCRLMMDGLLGRSFSFWQVCFTDSSCFLLVYNFGEFWWWRLWQFQSSMGIGKKKVDFFFCLVKYSPYTRNTRRLLLQLSNCKISEFPHWDFDRFAFGVTNRLTSALDSQSQVSTQSSLAQQASNSPSTLTTSLHHQHLTSLPIWSYIYASITPTTATT